MGNSESSWKYKQLKLACSNEADEEKREWMQKAFTKCADQLAHEKQKEQAKRLVRQGRALVKSKALHDIEAMIVPKQEGGAVSG